MSTRTKTKPEKPTALSVEDAAKRAEDARRHFHDLTKQLANGDGDVTADDLADARGRAQHADLQLQGAQARAQREQEAQLESDVDTFTQSWPKKLARAFSKISPTRKDSVDSLSKLYQAVANVETTRAGIQSDYNAMRPPDVPIDQDDDLPDHYRQTNPNRDHRIARLDPVKAVLGAAVEAINAAGMVPHPHRDLVRSIHNYVAGQEKLYRNATERDDLNRPKP